MARARSVSAPPFQRRQMEHWLPIELLCLPCRSCRMHIENCGRQYFWDRIVVGGYAIDPGVRRVLWSPRLHLRLMQK